MSGVVVLAGGTGGAKLARGMLDVVGADLTVIANTADDIELYGAYVSPDPDLCTFWLADRIDERGWGIDGDTFHAMDQLRELGVDVWFNLGDKDLAIGLERNRRLAEEETLTEALAALTGALGLEARVVPMSDGIVRTRVKAAGRWWPFQEFMIRHRAQGPVEDVAFDGIDTAPPSPRALDAIAAARAIVIGPSNPVISIRPILDLPGFSDALRAAAAPVIAVSPIVQGDIVKGPSEAFAAWAGIELDAIGIAEYYGDVLDGIVSDEVLFDAHLPALQTDTMMRDAAARERVARQTLDFALALA